MPKKTYLITGASDGIGKALAKRVANDDAKVIMHGRNSEKLNQAIAEVIDSSGNKKIYGVIADFSSLRQVEEMTKEINGNYPELDVLINNAGHLTDKYQLSNDGLELTFAVNYLAPFLLTKKLLPTLIKNAPSRIINVSSTAMGGGYLNFSDLQAENQFDGWQAYSNSKLAQVYFTHTLAERISDSGVTCNSLCPGLIDTNFMHTNNIFNAEARQHMMSIMRPPEQGADIPYYLATAEEMSQISGEFFIRSDIDKGKIIPLAWDKRIENKLWEVSNDYIANLL
ncbi:MAG: SDR family NAD(P)-dependent oxidoreductase [Pseudomonadota bacterium]|nr:SDR family NAD(P)-dependent oxidoreductase [Pseudomonadota bacterium]